MWKDLHALDPEQHFHLRLLSFVEPGDQVGLLLSMLHVYFIHNEPGDSLKCVCVLNIGIEI